MDPVVWAALGLVVTVGVMLLLLRIAQRSRVRRPPPRPFVPARHAVSVRAPSGPATETSSRGIEE